MSVRQRLDIGLGLAGHFAAFAGTFPSSGQEIDCNLRPAAVLLPRMNPNLAAYFRAVPWLCPEIYGKLQYNSS